MSTLFSHRGWTLAAALSCNAALCAAAAPPHASPAASPTAPLDEPIKPVPQSLHQDPQRAALGRRLFNDARLSANDSVSCASCHDLARGGGDLQARSLGFRGQPTQVNTPTVLNAALNFKQFWNGRADTLEAQIDIVVRNPIEMGSNWPQILDKLTR